MLFRSTGKNSVIIYSMKPGLKYLILVPRIILMDQLKKEIIYHNPKIKNKIQLIGDGDTTLNENKLITICVFNSVHLIEKQGDSFEKIFIDEAHHINKPAIYYENDEYFMDEDIVDEDIVDEDILDEYSEDDMEEEYISDDDSIEEDVELEVEAIKKCFQIKYLMI